MEFIYKHKKELLVLIGVIILLILFPRRCSTQPPKEPKITIVRDTVWQTKVDTFKIQTTQYETVYVAKKSPTKVIRDTIIVKDTTEFIKAKVYRDTLRNDDIDLYSYNLVDGNLLDSKLTYKLKVPREITVTKTIEHPKTFRSGLYFFSEIGGNTQQFSNLSFGLQYNRKGNWFISYRINLNEINPISHNLGVGFRIFK
ncbi:hypothetical protein [Pseudotenacibaculum haliotis]|uniref:Uncharacterized protein n=1 Tax=Pseudotenacibaculum haliotis TaxID=1862138 RepID=A0ABW5LV85_9FLAO